jgi:hypothetical protein
MAIHKQPGGRYWYYWAIIVSGIVFVIAYYVSDGFGLQP